jgi:hypothetical protein
LQPEAGSVKEIRKGSVFQLKTPDFRIGPEGGGGKAEIFRLAHAGWRPGQGGVARNFAPEITVPSPLFQLWNDTDRCWYLSPLRVEHRGHAQINKLTLRRVCGALHVDHEVDFTKYGADPIPVPRGVYVVFGAEDLPAGKPGAARFWLWTDPVESATAGAGGTPALTKSKTMGVPAKILLTANAKTAGLASEISMVPVSSLEPGLRMVITFEAESKDQGFELIRKRGTSESGYQGQGQERQRTMARQHTPPEGCRLRRWPDLGKERTYVEVGEA